MAPVESMYYSTTFQVLENYRDTIYATNFDLKAYQVPSVPEVPKVHRLPTSKFAPTKGNAKPAYTFTPESSSPTSERSMSLSESLSSSPATSNSSFSDDEHRTKSPPRGEIRKRRTPSGSQSRITDLRLKKSNGHTHIEDDAAAPRYKYLAKFEGDAKKPAIPPMNPLRNSLRNSFQKQHSPDPLANIGAIANSLRSERQRQEEETVQGARTPMEDDGLAPLPQGLPKNKKMAAQGLPAGPGLPSNPATAKRLPALPKEASGLPTRDMDPEAPPARKPVAARKGPSLADLALGLRTASVYQAPKVPSPPPVMPPVSLPRAPAPQPVTQTLKRQVTHKRQSASMGALPTANLTSPFSPNASLISRFNPEAALSPPHHKPSQSIDRTVPLRFPKYQQTDDGFTNGFRKPSDGQLSPGSKPQERKYSGDDDISPRTRMNSRSNNNNNNNSFADEYEYSPRSKPSGPSAHKNTWASPEQAGDDVHQGFSRDPFRNGPPSAPVPPPREETPPPPPPPKPSLPGNPRAMKTPREPPASSGLGIKTPQTAMMSGGFHRGQDIPLASGSLPAPPPPPAPQPLPKDAPAEFPGVKQMRKPNADLQRELALQFPGSFASGPESPTPPPAPLKSGGLVAQSNGLPAPPPPPGKLMRPPPQREYGAPAPRNVVNEFAAPPPPRAKTPVGLPSGPKAGNLPPPPKIPQLMANLGSPHSNALAPADVPAPFAPPAPIQPMQPAQQKPLPRKNTFADLEPPRPNFAAGDRTMSMSSDYDSWSPGSASPTDPNAPGTRPDGFPSRSSSRERRGSGSSGVDLPSPRPDSSISNTLPNMGPYNVQTGARYTNTLTPPPEMSGTHLPLAFSGAMGEESPRMMGGLGTARPGLTEAESVPKPRAAAELSISNFTCATGHRNMVSSANSTPVRCQTCAINPTSLHRCSSCALDICGRCRARLQQARGNLGDVVNQTAREKGGNERDNSQVDVDADMPPSPLSREPSDGSAHKRTQTTDSGLSSSSRDIRIVMANGNGGLPPFAPPPGSPSVFHARGQSDIPKSAGPPPPRPAHAHSRSASRGPGPRAGPYGPGQDAYGVLPPPPHIPGGMQSSYSSPRGRGPPAPWMEGPGRATSPAPRYVGGPPQSPAARYGPPPPSGQRGPSRGPGRGPSPGPGAFRQPPPGPMLGGMPPSGGMPMPRGPLNNGQGLGPPRRGAPHSGFGGPGLPPQGLPSGPRRGPRSDFSDREGMDLDDIGAAGLYSDVSDKFGAGLRRNPLPDEMYIQPTFGPGRGGKAGWRKNGGGDRTNTMGSSRSGGSGMSGGRGGMGPRMGGLPMGYTGARGVPGGLEGDGPIGPRMGGGAMDRAVRAGGI